VHAVLDLELSPLDARAVLQKSRCCSLLLDFAPFASRVLVFFRLSSNFQSLAKFAFPNLAGQLTHERFTIQHLRTHSEPKMKNHTQSEKQTTTPRAPRANRGERSSHHVSHKSCARAATLAVRMLLPKPKQLIHQIRRPEERKFTNQKRDLKSQSQN